MNDFLFLRLILISITLIIAIFSFSSCGVFVASTKPRQTAIPEDNGLTYLTTTTTLPPETYSEYLSELDEITDKNDDDDDNHYYTETEVPGRETFKDTAFRDTAFSYKNPETFTGNSETADQKITETTVPSQGNEDKTETISTTIPDEMQELLNNLPPVPSGNIIERE